MNIVEIRDLTKTYGDHEVFKNFNMTIEEHSFTVIKGGSGTGKTTLLNIIGVLDHYDRGEVILFQLKNIKPFSRNARKLMRTKLGFVFQNFALLDNETVESNLRIAMKKDKKAMDKICSALEQCGLNKAYLHKRVYECSGGEQQRLALARLLLKPCELILADEPTGSLDEFNKDQIYELLRMLQKQGKTVVVVTHDTSFMERADQVIDLDIKNYLLK